MEPEQMEDEHVMEAAEFGSKGPINRDRKRKADTRADTDDCDRRAKRITLAMTKPSFVMGHGSKMVRAETRSILLNLVYKLMRQQNWVEASGALSMLMKGTLRDRCPNLNRLKYSAAIEIVKHIEGDRMKSNRIRNIYDIWMRKIGSMKHRPIEERFMVHVEFIHYCLEEGKTEDAYHTALYLMQDAEAVNDPVSNMAIGLTFRQLWLNIIPEEMQLRDSPQSHSPILSGPMISNSDRCSVSDAHGDGASYLSNSETSVMNDKLAHVDSEGHTKASFQVDSNVKVENDPQTFEAQDFDVISAEEDENEASFSENRGYQDYVSIFSALEGLNPQLLPIHLPPSIEIWENAISLCGEFLNDHYKNAVKYLDLALKSNPPMLDALLPLVQLWLIGGRFDKALEEVENFCRDSNGVFPFRLRAGLVEHFDRSNDVLLPTLYEQVLKKDPTCRDSLGKLVHMHKNGKYSLESLLEMIATHLDGTFAEYDTWRELAVCFLKLSHLEEDRVSTAACSMGTGGHKPMTSLNINTNLKMLTEKNLRNGWKIRCRWWSTRHFGHKITSETPTGNLELLTYKAACASHMYGRDFRYVVQVYNFLDEQSDKDLLLFLRSHMENSFRLELKVQDSTNK